MNNPIHNRINVCFLTAFSAAFLLQPHISALAQQAAVPAPAATNGERANLEKRAKSGEAAAQFELARQWEHGIGSVANPSLAARWYRLAADQGLAKAEYSLGRLYFSGEGVRQDQVEAVKWFRLAAAQGYALAQHRLARAYELGQGVPLDLTGAYQWYCLAANSNGLVSSQVMLQALKARMTETQIAQAQARAASLLIVAGDRKTN